MSDLILHNKDIINIDRKIQTDIFNYRSSEFFINMKESDIPPKGHPDRADFVKWEREKCKNGVTINGIYITGRLYYHLNYHKILIDTISGERVVSNPLLRDNEWIMFNEYEQCIKEKKGFIIGGSRQISKTEFQCSTSLYMINLYKNTEALLLFTNSQDKQTYTKKAQVALMSGESFMMRQPVDNNWKNSEIRFGYTNKDNTVEVFARLFMYNTDGDNASEAGAGKTPNYFSYDEVAKENMRSSYEAVLPALVSPYGLRCSPILAFTGGNVERSKDAENMFFNPESARLKSFTYEGKQTGFFMGGWYRQDFKEKIKFGDFLKQSGYNIPKDSEFNKIDYYKTNFELADKVLDDELEVAKKSKDPTAYLKHRMYFPRTLKDMFAKNNTNNFNKEFIDQQLEYLKDVGYDKVEVFRDIKTGEVKHKFSFAPVIEDWRKPVFLDTPLKIWDFPKHTEYGVHVIGLDSVREDETNSSDSLAYFTVLRRLHSDLEDPFRGKQVASWLGRKKTVKEMLQLLLDVAEWYNAQILYEHVDRSVLDFFESKRKMHLLIDTIPLQKEIAIKTKTKNNKGLRPTVANQQFLLNSTLGWVNEELEDDSLGYSRIMDEVLLNQLAEYDPEENLDCYIGFSHAVAAYNYFEKFGVPEVPNSNKEQITSNKKPVIYNAFGIPFNKKSKSVFGF